jgi:hypoxanthine-guanine phosphoribosyltransferase
MSEKLIVSWEEYTNTVEKLAVQIDNSGYKPTILIGIMRGAGLCIDLLSRIWKMKTGYLSVQSYSGKGVEDTQGSIMFSRQISSIAEGNDFEKILLIDDLSDTGLTLNKSIEWLKNHDPIKDFIKSCVRGRGGENPFTSIRMDAASLKPITMGSILEPPFSLRTMTCSCFSSSIIIFDNSTSIILFSC